jgi:hypothetical protein
MLSFVFYTPYRRLTAWIKLFAERAISPKTQWQSVLKNFFSPKRFFQYF